MPTPNPKYNPDWKAIHDHHNAERARIGQEMAALTRQDQALYDAGQTFGSAERLAIIDKRIGLQKKWDEHHQACRESFQMQHPTIQEYAAWVFSAFDPATGCPREAEATVPAIDFEKLTSLEDVGEAWRQANRAIEDEALKKRLAKSAPRPDGVKP
jgi:hypothetical protein